MTKASGPGMTGVRVMAGALAGVTPATAFASFLPPAMMDAAATYIAWFVVIAMPIGGIVLFWLVHILPEKVAEKRHHPQKDAIQTLCLLSLVFGGMLWPLAWLWAYTKPTIYRMAYGTDKNEEYWHDVSEKVQAGDMLEKDLTHLKQELDAMAARGTLPARLAGLQRELNGASGETIKGANS